MYAIEKSILCPTYDKPIEMLESFGKIKKSHHEKNRVILFPLKIYKDKNNAFNIYSFPEFFIIKNNMI